MEESLPGATLPMLETASERLDRLGIYGEIKRELVKRGIPAAEIAFIHDFDTPAKKAKAFADVNAGRIRILLASTEKAGTGVNMQERLYALHHLDAPWRPADVEQREGRILRQGNRYPNVRIFNYVTENSFDGYMWQTLENKARFIAQIMTGEVTARTTEDVDDLVITAAQVKAIASGNPRILERVGLEVELARLARLYSVWRNSRRQLQWEAQSLPSRVQEADARAAAHQQAIAMRDQAQAKSDTFVITLRSALDTSTEQIFTERAQAGAQIERLRHQISVQNNPAPYPLGAYRGFVLWAQKQRNRDEAFYTPVAGWFTAPGGNLQYEFKFSETSAGTLQSIDAQLRSLDTHCQRARQAQGELHHKQTQLAAELGKGWEYAAQYEALQDQLQLVNQALAADGSAVGEAPNFAPLDADARRASLITPAPLPASASISAEPTAPPTFVVPDEVVTTCVVLSETAPAPVTTQSPQITLEVLRQQLPATPGRKATRPTTSAAQMSLW